jgi:hypothetical protein
MPAMMPPFPKRPETGIRWRMLTHTVVYLIDVMIILHSCGVKSQCRWGNEDMDRSISVAMDVLRYYVRWE